MASQAAAAEAILNQLLADPKSNALIRGLSEKADGEAGAFIRKAAVHAGKKAISGPGAAKAPEVLKALETILDDAGTKDERVVAGLLELSGELGGPLEKSEQRGLMAGLMSRLVPKLSDESEVVAAGASRGLAAAVRGAKTAGRATIDQEVKALFSTSMNMLKAAKTATESRAGALGVGAIVGGAGVSQLAPLNVMTDITALLEAKASKDAPHAKEAAALATEQLALQLGTAFEPHGVPLLRTLVALYADKDKKVADAAVRGVRALLSQLSPLAIKLVLPALYDGMESVQWRSRVECISALSVLAEHAPTYVAPQLAVAMPKLMECIGSSHAKVLEAASAALPVLMSCVENSETQKLKPLMVKAFLEPETTLACLDEILATTFVNAMDASALAFLMPLLLRGLKDANYELVKKACVSSGNVCALVKSASEIAPFIPTFEPILTKCMDHSSPVVREAAQVAKEKLLDGAGDLVDPEQRPSALAALIKTKLEGLVSALPDATASFAAATTAALLELELGGAVKIAYLYAAPLKAARWLSAILSEYQGAPSHAELVKLGEYAVGEFRERMSAQAKAILNSADGKDYAVDIQNAILAFAGRVLLKGCDLRFERGHRYGLVGQNGTGKTTLLNRLGAKDITGFPQELRTWYIRHEVLCDDGVDVRAYLKANAPAEKRTDAAVNAVLEQCGIMEHAETYVNSLSGGWKMKLSIALSMTHEPELLLLDEPTNHLDRDAIEWLTRHLLALDGVTICVVSHDYDFIDEVCTDITHYDNGGQLGKPCKFVYYPMTFGEFQKLKPEIAAGLPRADKGVANAADVLAANRTPSEVSEASAEESLSKSMDSMSVTSDSSEGAGIVSTINKVDEMIAAGLILPMRFPDPGKPEGIRTFRKPIMTLKNVSFKYPEGDKAILNDVSATLTLGSRAVIVGGNGSGKSTTLKLLIGDLEPEEGAGEVWKHHNLRQAYVAQQSLHHLEDYVMQTPIHYLQERFRQGLDAELGKLKSLTITDEEKKQMDEPGAVYEVCGRASKGKHLWYEVRKRGRVASDTQSYPLDEIEKLFKPYVMKMIKNFDQRQQAIDSGMAIRPVTAAEILKHLEDFGIDSQLAHGKIRQMSGGQRQRLVICAAFWSKPHVIALDEPTNYLDNDSVAALTKALKDFKGAVVTVSENEAFTAEISNEKWIVENGSITMVQLRDAKAR